MWNQEHSKIELARVKAEREIFRALLRELEIHAASLDDALEIEKKINAQYSEWFNRHRFLIEPRETAIVDKATMYADLSPVEGIDKNGTIVG